jgi:hypothetical protein
LLRTSSVALELSLASAQQVRVKGWEGQCEILLAALIGPG